MSLLPIQILNSDDFPIRARMQIFLLLSAVILLLLASEFLKQNSRSASLDYVSSPLITTKVNISSYLWPFPAEIKCIDTAYSILNNEMHFALMYGSGLFPNAYPILKQAFSEYYRIILNQTRQVPDNFQFSSNLTSNLGFNQLNVTLRTDDVSLTLDTKEDYFLSVGYPASTLIATTVYGALRGMETFSQLILRYSNDQLFLHDCEIADAPFFKHRGILYDTSRHYLPVPLLKKHIELMAWNKFNVFHWHIVDIQSFPYYSETFPKLSGMGAYTPRHTYSKSDVQEVIEHANTRGIRVLVEFDTPGHTASWGKGQPNLLTPCYKNGEPDGTYGPINAISNETWPFLRALFAEITGDFKDQYIHLGGDEVSFDCWKSNPDIQQWMQDRNLSSYVRFEEFYINELISLVEQLNKSYIVWQEVFDNGNRINNSTIVHVWKGRSQWANEMHAVTKAGFQALLSSCWYLNRIAASPDYYAFFRCDPLSFGGTSAQESLVIGGEAAVWGEWVDATNSLSRTWPRAGPTAERLWSGSRTIGISNSEIYDRLHKHRCRLLNRDVPAQPLGPGHCSLPWEPLT